MLVLPSLILVKLFIQEPLCFRTKSFASCLFKNPCVSVRNPGQVTQDFVRKHKGSWIYNLQRISYGNNRLDFTFKLPRISYGNSRFSSKMLFPYEILVKLPWISYGNSILIFRCYFRTKSIPSVICWVGLDYSGVYFRFITGLEPLKWNFKIPYKIGLKCKFFD